MHPCMQIIDVWINNKNWQVINFYHDVQDKTALPALLGLDINTTTPTLVIGDFNPHSPTWSPPNIPHSGWAAKVEEWVSTNLLTLANDPGVIMRKGVEHKCDSTIDLTWYNEVAIQSATFSGLKLNWEGCLSSDHAMLYITGSPGGPPVPLEAAAPEGFLLDP